MSEGYQTTGHRNFWAFAAVATIVVSGMAVSDFLGNFISSIWVAVILGFGAGVIVRLITSMINTSMIMPDEDQVGWRRYINSPFIAVLGFGLLSSFYIFQPLSNSIGQLDYAKAFIGGMWLSLAFDQFRLWYKNRKVN